MKYVNKPKYVKAIQYNGDNIEEILNFIGKKNILTLEYDFISKYLKLRIKIEDTPEFKYYVGLDISYYIVYRGEDFYKYSSWSPESFAKMYDLVEENAEQSDFDVDEPW